MSVDPSEPALGSGPPPLAWATAANRQSLAVRLLATTVHDVNNILQVMSGAAEVLALDPTPAAVARRTTSIVEQSAAATTVLLNLMTFVRSDGSALEGARPLALARQALAFRQHAFKKLRLAATVEGDDVECVMARQHAQQVLLNLIVNAEQALAAQPDGALRVTVRGGHDEVRIVVADNGPGLSDARAAAAFAWPPAPGAAPGTLGLGLRVSRALVHDAAGTFAIETPPDGGTSVVVTLPRLRR